MNVGANSMLHCTPAIDSSNHHDPAEMCLYTTGILFCMCRINCPGRKFWLYWFSWLYNYKLPALLPSKLRLCDLFDLNCWLERQWLKKLRLLLSSYSTDFFQLWSLVFGRYGKAVVTSPFESYNFSFFGAEIFGAWYNKPRLRWSLWNVMFFPVSGSFGPGRIWWDSRKKGEVSFFVFYCAYNYRNRLLQIHWLPYLVAPSPLMDECTSLY